MVHLPHRVMFNLGAGELAIIFIVLIIAVGPDRLPTMMKGLGKAIRTVRQASREIRTTVGIDEMMREDVLAPPRRPPPKAVVSRPAQPAQLPAQPNAPVPEKVEADATSANAAPASAAPPAPAGATLAAPTAPEAPREPSPQKEPE